MSLIFNESEQRKDFHSSREISEAMKNKVMGNLNKIPMTFITNAGQIDSKVKYYAKGRNFGFYFTKEEVALSFIKHASEECFNKNSTSKGESYEEENQGIGVALAMQFIDANPDVKIEGQVKDSGRVNYIKGNHPEKWYTDLCTYEKVVYKELWKGIDLVFYEAKNRLKYEFIVHPGADFKDIKLSYKGSEGIALDKEGNLLIKSELGILIDERPVSYQEIDGRRVAIGSQFVVKKHENKERNYSFEIEKTINPDYPIIIDPGLVYSTYLGGSETDTGSGVAVDNTGSAYVTGQTLSVDFPTTAGVFQPAIAGDTDAFVTKLNASGTGLIYSTYLGGSGTDLGSGISVDNSGSAYVTGQTNSGNFPTTAGAFQPAIAGDTDAFVTKLNATGTGLIYSTYLGGSDTDFGNGISVDNSGSAYVTGLTTSGDFPTTAGAFQSALGGTQDAFVTKLNATGTGLIYSTFLGGSGGELGSGIAVDSTDNAYIIGVTDSVDFPLTAGAFQPGFGGGISDAFVTKLNASGTGLIYSTYLGGSGTDFGNDIAVDNTGSAYVIGQTSSLDFPTTAGVFQPAIAGDTDAFVTKLNTSGTDLFYSTYLGGSSIDFGNGIAVDNNGSAYVTGVTISVDYPTTEGAFQQVFEGAIDAFVTRLNAAGTGLIYSTYLGGSVIDFGNAIAIDNNGSAYITGQTNSLNFPITPGAFQPTIGGNPDAFVTKINTNTISPKIRINNQNITAIVYEAD